MNQRDIDTTAKNHYDILDVSKDASTEEIQTLLRGITGTYHPDNTNITSKEFQRIKNAKDVLTNKNTREKYDANPRQLQINTNKDRVTPTTEVSISVSEPNTVTGKQYTVITPQETTRTDGNGNVTLTFSEPGEKEITANKQDKDTTKYLPDTTTVTVDKKKVKLALSLTTEHGSKIKDTVTVGDTIHVTVRRQDTYEIVEGANIEIKGQETISTTGQGTFTVQDNNQILIKASKQSEEISFQQQVRYLFPTTQKELTGNIKNRVLYVGDTLHMDVYANGAPEPNVTVELTFDNTTHQYETTANGEFTREMNTPGVVHITLKKKTNDGKTYTPYTDTITVYQKENTTLNEHTTTIEPEPKTANTDNTNTNQNQQHHSIQEPLLNFTTTVKNSIQATIRPSSLRTPSADTSMIYLTADLLTDIRLITVAGKTVFLILIPLLTIAIIMLLFLIL